jgi:nitroreductase
LDTWDAIRSRRNVREFANQPVSREQIDRILEAGRLSPSARNGQPWDFIAVMERGRLTELAGVWRGAWHVAGAPAVIAIVAPRVTDREEELLYFDLGQAVMLMMLSASDQGLGTGHAAVSDQGLAQRLLGFPSDRFLAYMLSVGYPANGPLRPLRRLNRRPFEQVVHRETW